MSDGLTFKTDTLNAAILRLASTSKKAAVDILKQQAKLLFLEVVKVTPPAGGKKGQTLQGRAAEQAGKLAIVRDVHETYGMPGRAYSDLQSKNQGEADAFWSAFKNDRLDAAAKIVKSTLGKSFVPFDGGQAARGFLGKKRKKEPLFYISNPAALQDYIKQTQPHVWYLASGWASALRTLGAKLPYGLDQHHAPGTIKVEITDQRIQITMANQVDYGPRLKNVQQQIDFALKVRVGALDDRWNTWLATLARETGFKKKG